MQIRYTDQVINIIDENCHNEFDENLFYALVLDAILDPTLNPNNLNMEDGRAPAGQQCP